MPYSPPFDHPNVPGIYLRFSNALAVGDPEVPHRAVVLGTRLAGGAVPQHVPRRLFSVAEAESAWGQGSMIAEMVRAFFAQGTIELWGVGVDEAEDGAAAVGALTISGVATAAGTLQYLVAGERVRVGIVKGDDAPAVVAKLVDALAARPTLPVTGAAGDGLVELTCRWTGASGNTIDLRLDPTGRAPAGLLADVTPMAGGATDPEVDGALASLGDAKYDTVACGYRDAVNIGHVDAWLEARWGPLVQKEGHAFFAHLGSFAELTTLAADLNSKFVTVVAPSRSPTPPWCWAAATASADAVITKLQPNAPRWGIALQGIEPAALEARFPSGPRDTLLENGISTATGTASGSAWLERLLTTSTLSEDGFPDESYRELAVMRLLGRLRYDLQVWRARYKDWLVSSDETQSSLPKVMTPKRLRGFLTALYQRWIDQSLCQDLAFFQKNLVVEVAANKTDFNLFIPVKLVYPLNAMAGEVAFV